MQVETETTKNTSSQPQVREYGEVSKNDIGKISELVFTSFPVKNMDELRRKALFQHNWLVKYPWLSYSKF